jgi:hypothetical protein
MAEKIAGTITNSTSGKAAAGVSVTLVDPMGGMAELATAKSDSAGRFTFSAPPAQGPRLVRAEKGGVNYFKMVTPGTANVDLSVYDAASSVEGISGSADVVRLQTQDSMLQGVEMFVIQNASNPPRTLASDATFEFVLPDGAQVDAADAQAPNGQPISAMPKPAKEKNHYAFSFALKPGETRFQVAYHLPYNGTASITPQLTRNFEHYVLVLPSTMSFTAKDAKQFQAMADQPGTTVQVSLHAQAGQNLGYTISGTGTVRDEQAEAPASGGRGMGGGAAADNRPGGGLGRPIDAPDGLAKYRWYILAALITVLAGGGIWTHERTKQEEAANAAAVAATSTQAAPSVHPAQQSAPANLLLSALKEELFQLEIERQQGKIAPEEYDKARAALEQTLQRALARAHG